MKKLFVIIGILIAAWLGTTWYTGNMVEPKYREAIDNSVAKVNSSQDLAVIGIKVDIENISFEKSFFSSKIAYDVVLQSKNVDKTEKHIIKINETLHHGPFPLAQLANFNFTPIVAFIEAESIISDIMDGINELYDISLVINDNQKIHYQYALGYNGSLKGSINLPSGKFTNKNANDNAVFTWDTMTIATDTDKDYRNYQIDMNLPQFGLSINQVPLIQMNGLKSSQIVKDGNLKNLKPSSISASMDSMVINTNQFNNIANADDNEAPFEKIELKQVNINGGFDLYKDESLVDISFNYGADMILLDDKSIIGYELKGKLTQLDSQLIHKIITAFINDIEQASLGNLEYSELSNVFQTIEISDFTATEPGIDTIYALKNSAGISTVTMQIQANKMFEDQEPASVMAAFNALVSKFDWTLSINKPMVEELMAAVYEFDRDTETVNKEEFMQIRKQDLEQFANTLVAEKVATDSDKEIKIHLYLKDQKLYISDREITDNELQSALFMLMMMGYGL